MTPAPNPDTMPATSPAGGRELPSDLLARPAAEGARRLALALLARAEEADARLPDPEETEALHDFRVAIRRLRSTLRAYRPHLADSVGRKLRARLRALAAATNPGRDSEVQLSWLAGVRPSLRPHERRGHAWLAARLEERRDAAYRRVHDEVRQGFAALAPRLRKRLSRYRVEVQLEEGWHPVSMRQALAGELEGHAAALAAALGEVRSLADEAKAHEARIEAKRLRYLLEPFADDLAGAKEAVKRLRALQDLLGELNDAHLLAAEVGRAIEDAAAARARDLHELALAGEADRLRTAQRRGERAGLLALTRRLAERREQLFARLAKEWLADGAAPRFAAEVATLADEPAGNPTPP